MYALVSKVAFFNAMNKDELLKYLQSIDDRKDLLYILNFIKKQKYGDNTYPISLDTIRYCSNMSNEDRYHAFKIRKKSGGTREIFAPNPRLHDIQNHLNDLFKFIYTPHPAANGFTEGRSIVSGAEVHTGHNYILSIDLSDFFPSIDKSRLWKRLQVPPFCFKSRLADIISWLCCVRIPNESGEGEPFREVLPQGAPTSPILTNAICERMDKKLTKLARHYGVHYTRYADDMAFSSMHNVYQKNSPFMQQLRTIIEQEHFVMNEKKTRLQKRGGRQEVTGVVVNEKVNVASEYIRHLRYLLYIWKKKGYDAAFKCFYTHYKSEKGYIKKGEPIMENVIEGKLNFLRMVRGDYDAIYLRLRQQYDELCPTVFMDTSDKEKRIFVKSLPIKQFEEDLNSKIDFRVTQNGGIVGHFVLHDREVWPYVKKKLQQEILKKFPNAEHKDSISFDGVEKWWITLCREAGKNYWLISDKELVCDKLVTIGNRKIPIEKLLDEWENRGIEYAAELFSLYADGKLSEEEIAKKYADFVKEHESSSKTVISLEVNDMAEGATSSPVIKNITGSESNSNSKNYLDSNEQDEAHNDMEVAEDIVTY